MQDRMRILLLGEYSNVHNTLAGGLRELGHEVTVASNGDFWRDYSRDINLARDMGITGTVSFLYRLLLALPKMRGYDIVQLINPVFLELKAERLYRIFDYLKRHNGKVVLLAAGDDYYYPELHTRRKVMRYSDFYIGDEEHCCDFVRTQTREWLYGEKGRLTRYVAKRCDAIVACAYEYWLPYNLSEDTSPDGERLNRKLYSIPFAYSIPDKPVSRVAGKVRVFIGISRERSEMKGTDIMLQAARDLQRLYPDRMELLVANGVSFDEYSRMMDSSDVLLDQIYSYGPGMNALLAMSKGIVAVSGAEPEHYELLGENEVMPIVNVYPSYEDVYRNLEKLILNPELVNRLKLQSREYVARNHEYIRVSRQYVELYSKLLG